jgi:DNA-binding transcriptional regulator YhcF (GntR family)
MSGYAELKADLLERMRAGDLPAGAKLPTVRALADDLGLAPNTVARAYRELEQAGAIETRGRNGTFVALSSDAAARAAQQAAAAYLTRTRALGIPDAEALGYVTAAASTAGRRI